MKTIREWTYCTIVKQSADVLMKLYAKLGINPDASVYELYDSLWLSPFNLTEDEDEVVYYLLKIVPIDDPEYQVPVINASEINYLEKRILRIENNL